MRADQLLVQCGLAESRTSAQRLIMAGQVRADGELVHKPSAMVAPEADLEVESGPQYVSRGGEKLVAALAAFGIEPVDWICADIGSSTGGFTDCLLQAGAEHVYAVDVGKGQLHWKLRKDARVTAMEGTNARNLEAFPREIDLAVIDVSFISLNLIWPKIPNWLKVGGQIVALVKPQFEAGKDEVGKQGVVRDPATHTKVLEGVIAGAAVNGFALKGLIRSPLLGPKGNVEFLLWLEQASDQKAGPDPGTMIQSVLE